MKKRVCIISDSDTSIILSNEDVGRKLSDLQGSNITHFVFPSDDCYTDNLGAFIKQLFPNSTIVLP